MDAGGRCAASDVPEAVSAGRPGLCSTCTVDDAYGLHVFLLAGAQWKKPESKIA